jgi:hypothetical protein
MPPSLPAGEAALLAPPLPQRFTGGLRPRLTVERILRWADAHRRRTGKWPDARSGPVLGVSGQTWLAVNLALTFGCRGLAGGSSLARLLAERRGRRNQARAPRLTFRQVLAWADAHRARTRRWPTVASGPVAEAHGETWEAVNRALMRGSRGLAGGSSLARLLAERRGKRNKARTPPLTAAQVLLWADRHRARTGRWPTAYSGQVRGAAGENWRAISSALWAGCRGLNGGDTLRRFLRRHGRDVPDLRGRPRSRSA